MTLEELNKIIEICYTKRVEVVKKGKKRVLVEHPISAEDIVHIIAREFGFILINQQPGEKTDGQEEE
jgi:hypothetical protein